LTRRFDLVLAAYLYAAWPGISDVSPLQARTCGGRRASASTRAMECREYSRHMSSVPIRPAYSMWPRSVLQRVFTHDVYHCGELPHTLGMMGLPQIDLWD